MQNTKPLFNPAEKYRNNYRENLSHIRNTDPLLYGLLSESGGEPSFEPTKDGGLTLKLNRTYLESRYHPKKSALRHLHKEEERGFFLLFLGSGLGYHINAALKGKRRKGVVIEKDVQVFKAALHVVEPEVLQKVTPLVALPLDRVLKRLASLVFQTASVVKHSQSINLSISYYTRVEEFLLRRMRELTASKVTEEATHLLWVRNILKNMRHLESRCFGTDCFLHSFSGPVILVASGPYLVDITRNLKRWARNIPVVALLPSVPYLMRNGIVPDFVVTTDAGFGNTYRFLRDVETPLLTTYSVHPTLLKNWRGKSFLFSHMLPLEERLSLIKNVSLRVPMQGTSSGVMLAVARSMGFDRIYLAGFDFVHRGIMDHHPGAGFESSFLACSFRFLSLYTSLVDHLRGDLPVMVESQEGGSICSTHKLVLYKNWLEAELAAEDLYRLNNGACMNNISIAPGSMLEEHGPDVRKAFVERLTLLKPSRFKTALLLHDLRGISFLLEKNHDLSKEESLLAVYELFFGRRSTSESRQTIMNKIVTVKRAFRNSLMSLEVPLEIP